MTPEMLETARQYYRTHPYVAQMASINQKSRAKNLPSITETARQYYKTHPFVSQMASLSMDR